METFFVRSRGRVAGPFDRPALEQMARRGRLSRFDQISQDKREWSSAAELVATVAPPVRTSPRDAFQDGQRQVADGADSRGQAVVAQMAPRETQYFYAQHGEAIGPVSVSVLRSLVVNGTIGPDDQVWSEGAELAVPARQVAALSSHFTDGIASNTRGRSTSSKQQPGALGLFARVTSASTIWYVTLGGTLLTFSMSPIMIVPEGPVWWWQRAANPVSTAWLLMTLCYIVASIAALVLAPLTSGVGRGVCMASFGLGLSLLWLIAGFSTAPVVLLTPVLVAVLATSLPLLLLAVWSACRARDALVEGGPRSMRVTQIVLGSVALLPTSILLLLLTGPFQLVTLIPFGGTSIYLATAGVVFLTIAACVLAIVAGKPTFTPGVNLAAEICLGLLWLIGCGCAVAFVAALHDGATLGGGAGTGMIAGAVSYVVARLACIVVLTFLLFAVGLRELFVAAHRSHAR